jgi:N-acetylneuraminic acid mutarotase
MGPRSAISQASSKSSRALSGSVRAPGAVVCQNAFTSRNGSQDAAIRINFGAEPFDATVMRLSASVVVRRRSPRKAGWRFTWPVLAVCLAHLSEVAAQPLAPGGLTATAVSSTQIDLAWLDNSSNEQGFRIERSLDGIAFAEDDVTTSNVTARASTNLSPGIKYYFRVRAFNGSGNSPYSNTNNATTRTPLAQWRLTKFTPAQLTNSAVSGLAADPDADGLKNIVEHGLNREPFSPDAGGLSAAGIEQIVPDDFLTCTYVRNAAAIDLEFSARVSSDLVTWLSGSNVLTGPIPVSTNAGMVTEKFRANTALESAPQQFIQLAVAYTGVRNSWEIGTPSPLALDEVAGGVIGEKLYVVGGGNSATLAYDIPSGTWTNVLRARPFVGNHHAAEVFGGRLYVLGGLGSGSGGRVQIYDPVTNGWSLGAAMPFAGGSCNSAVINGQIYVASGIVGSSTTNALARYHPGSNTWTTLAPMPVGRNHAASGTDGSKFYVFGGRTGGNALANGFDTLQIYDPAGNTWVSTTDPGSTLAPLPQMRGGMGKAVFYNGDFFVIGGETSSGAGATANRVYNRVDIYNVASNTWRLGTPMPTARHGIYPVLHGTRTYVAAGGVVAGGSSSTLLEIYIAP